MSEESMKILKMLEDGKITAAEAGELLLKVETLEEKERRPKAPSGSFSVPPIPPVPTIPQMPDISRIVNNALQDAFSGVSFTAEGTPVEGDLTYKGVAFAGALLEHSDLADARMDTETRLEGADLRYASLSDTDLRGANLQGANLSYSDFSEAKLRGANLQGAQLHHANYSEADFRGADLRGADLSLSNLSEASFKNVVQPGLMLRGMDMPGVKYEGQVADDDVADAGAEEDVDGLVGRVEPLEEIERDIDAT